MFLSCLITAALSVAAPDSTARTVVLSAAESLRVTVDGPPTGPVVVIIPGLVSPAFAFRRVLPVLADSGVRAIVIEPLGVGWSSHPSDADYSYSAQAARIAAVLDTLHVSRAVIMGHVGGATIALRLAINHPLLVRGVLLIEGGALESPSVPGVRSALKYAFVIRLFAGRGRLKKELRKGLIASSGDTTWITDPVIESYTQGNAGDVGAVLRALKGMQKSVEPDSLIPRLHQIQVPVRLLLGGAAHEGGPAPSRVHTLERRIPDFRWRFVYGSGLHIHEEQPEAVVEELLRLVHGAGP
jgi:pimeloyl-ACP methyl ester carboxylesterase